MDGHLSFLRTACRLCGKVLSRKSDFADKSLSKNELLNQFRINIEEDLEVSALDANDHFIEFVAIQMCMPKSRPQNDLICGQVTLKETVHVIRKPEGVLQKVLKKRL